MIDRKEEEKNDITSPAGISGFRNNQLEYIEAVLARQNIRGNPDIRWFDKWRAICDRSNSVTISNDAIAMCERIFSPAANICERVIDIVMKYVGIDSFPLKEDAIVEIRDALYNVMGVEVEWVDENEEEKEDNTAEISKGARVSEIVTEDQRNDTGHTNGSDISVKNKASTVRRPRNRFTMPMERDNADNTNKYTGRE